MMRRSPPRPTAQKIVPRRRLAKLVKSLHRRGLRIVTTNGSFDLLHAGHVKYLEEARRQGDVLIIGLNSDSSIRKYKGPHRPIIPQPHRARLLAALECVDYVTIFGETDPRTLLSIIRPDVHVNGAEYGRKCIEADVVKQGGGRLHLIPKFFGLSTSRIIEKLKASDPRVRISRTVP